MDKINITICLGTTCHLMGASHLQTIAQDLPAAINDFVEIKWERCLGYCNSDAGNSPFVLINGQILQDATLPGIVEKIELLIKSKV